MRSTRLLSTVLLLLGLTVYLSPAADASISCTSRHVHYAIRDGSVAVRVGWIEMGYEVCYNGSTHNMTMTSAWSDSDETGPGKAAGFILKFSNPYRTSFRTDGLNGGFFGYTAKGSLRDCISHWISLFCSSTETFKVHVHVDMWGRHITPKPWFFTLQGRRFSATWTHRCTNKVCGVRFG